MTTAWEKHEDFIEQERRRNLSMIQKAPFWWSMTLAITFWLIVILILSAHSFGQEQKWKWVSLTATNAAVTAYDGLQTAHTFHEQESAWLYGYTPRNHPVRLGLTMGAQVGLGAVASYVLRHHRSRFWAVPETTLISLHTQGIVHNVEHGVKP